MANSLSDLKQIKLAALGGTGASIADKERSFYAAGSGLPVTRSITDHKIAFFRIQIPNALPNSLTDLEFLYWTFLNPANNVKSHNDRAMIYYGS
jgi:hypothetical protein